MRTEIKRILTFGLHDGPVSRSQLFLAICLVSVMTGIVALFCGNTDHPVICFFLFLYIAAVFVSSVRGRLNTVGEEVPGGCLFGLMAVFSILIPPLLLYLFFAKDKIAESVTEDVVKETIGTLGESGPTAKTPFPALKNLNEEPGEEVRTDESAPIDYADEFRSFIESIEKPVPANSVDFQCFICNRRSKESLPHEGRSFRGGGLNGPTNQRKDFTSQNLRKAGMSRGVFDWSTFDRADLSGADMSNSYFYQASFAGACLKDANLEGSDLTASNFRGAHLSGARLLKARVGGANFANSDLDGADFLDAELLHRNPKEESLIGKYPNFDGTNSEKARNLDVERHARELGGDISEDGYLKPKVLLTKAEILHLVDIALGLERWVTASFGVEGNSFDRDLIEASIKLNPAVWLRARNQQIFFIVANWERSKEIVWAERLATIVLVEVPWEVSSGLYGESSLLLARGNVERFFSEGVFRDLDTFGIPTGVLSVYLNSGINVFDRLREMRTYLLP